MYDSLTARFPLYEHYTVRDGYAGMSAAQAFDRILRGQALMQHAWKQVEIQVVSPEWTCIPSAFYDSDSILNLLAFSHPLGDDPALLEAEFPARAFHLISAFPGEWQDLMQRWFPEAQWIDARKPWIEAVFRETHPTAVYVLIQEGKADVLVLRDQRLLLANAFEFRHTDDFVYYLLLVYESLGLSRDLVPTVLCGEVVQDSELYQKTWRYVRDIHWLRRASEPALASGRDGWNLPRHQAVHLLHPEYAHY